MKGLRDVCVETVLCNVLGRGECVVIMVGLV